jgi:hypothetical protein
MWLSRIDDFSHLRFLILRQLNIPRGPIVFQSIRLSRAGDWNQTLIGNPGECDLRRLAAFPSCDLLNLVHDGTVLVEVFSLEFGDYGDGRCQ